MVHFCDKFDLAGLEWLDIFIFVGDEIVESLVFVWKQLDSILVLVDVLQLVLVVLEGLFHFRVSHFAGSEILHIIFYDVAQSLQLFCEQVIFTDLLSI